MDIQYSVIRYNGKTALLGIAKDISEQVSYMQAIEEQNRKLTEIAFMQSHLVRAPLARIMGLTGLLQKAEINGCREELIYMQQSTEELDQVIRRVIENTAHISAIQPLIRFENDVEQLKGGQAEG